MSLGKLLYKFIILLISICFILVIIYFNEEMLFVEKFKYSELDINSTESGVSEVYDCEQVMLCGVGVVNTSFDRFMYGQMFGILNMECYCMPINKLIIPMYTVEMYYMLFFKEKKAIVSYDMLRSIFESTYPLADKNVQMSDKWVVLKNNLIQEIFLFMWSREQERDDNVLAILNVFSKYDRSYAGINNTFESSDRANLYRFYNILIEVYEYNIFRGYLTVENKYYLDYYLELIERELGYNYGSNTLEMNKKFNRVLAYRMRPEVNAKFVKWNKKLCK